MWWAVNTHYSDDGHWVWDGERWQPTEIPAAHLQVTASRPLSFTDFTDRPSSGRLLVGLLLVGLLLGAAGGTAWVLFRGQDAADAAAAEWVEAIFDGDTIKACGLTDLAALEQTPAACEENLSGLRRSARRIRRQHPEEVEGFTTRIVELARESAVVAVEGPEEPWLRLEMSKTGDGWKVREVAAPAS